MRRPLIATTAFLLLAAALYRIPDAMAGQGAVSLSKAGQEDLTFWVNHNGLTEIDVAGEVGFGDMARILMRRRSNAAYFRGLRDRFVFRAPQIEKLDPPELHQSRFVIAQGRPFNFPVISGGKGAFEKVVEAKPGVVKRTVAGREITLDVRPVHRLHVRVVDEQGKPVNARVYLTGSDGLGYAPKGTISRYAPLPAETFFHAEPEFDIDLPAGGTTVEATRGLEYELTRKTINLTKAATVEVRLKRWINMAERGWYSADAHIHANYTAAHHQSVTPEDVLRYTLGEDLHIPNMMVANSFGDFVHDRALFEGKPHRLSRPPYYIYWNEEMRNAGLYGHMCLFGLKRLAEPVYTGFKDTPFADDYPPNYTLAKDAQDQGGAVTYAHPGYGASFEGASCRELPVDLALGAIDAMDVFSNNPEEVAMELWYKLLSAGFRLGISAGSDSFTNVADHYVPGGHRVYAQTGTPLDYASWIKAYKAGRTTASNGPIVMLTVNGQGPGADIKLPAGRQTLKVAVEVRSNMPVEAAELIVNGKSITPVPKTLTLDRSAWIAARVKGSWNRMVLNDTAALGHTSPIYVTVGDTPMAQAEAVRFYIDWIDKLIQRTAQRARFSSEDRKREVIALFTKARQVYADRLATARQP